MTTDLATVSEQCRSITADMSIEQVMDIRNDLMVIEDRVREAKKSLNAALMEYIEANGPFQVGEVKYYVGEKKKTVCVDVPTCIEALLTRLGGDFGEFCKLLASQPLKPGAARGVLEKEWDQHFRVEIVKDVKTGKPVREAKAVNEKFLPAKSTK